MFQGNLQPSAILFVANEFGDVILDWSSPQSEAVFNSQLAYLITDILEDGSVRSALRDFDRPAALTPEGSQHWSVAYSPQRVIAVWAPQPVENFTEIFSVLHLDLPIRSWTVRAA